MSSYLARLPHRIAAVRVCAVSCAVLRWCVAGVLLLLIYIYVLYICVRACVAVRQPATHHFLRQIDDPPQDVAHSNLQRILINNNIEHDSSNNTTQHVCIEQASHSEPRAELIRKPRHTRADEQEQTTA